MKKPKSTEKAAPKRRAQTKPKKAKVDPKSQLMAAVCSRPLGADALTLALSIGKMDRKGEVYTELNALQEAGFVRRFEKVWQPTPAGVIAAQNEPAPVEEE